MLSLFRLAVAVTAALPAVAAPASYCPVELHEEREQLAEAELALRLARADVAAYQEIRGLIDGLWKAEAIDRMTWLQAGYTADGAELTLERAEIALARQRSLLDFLEATCGTERPRSDADAARLRKYLRADCDQQAKAIDVAANDLAFAREHLTSVLDLRAGRVATRQDEILARLAVTRGEIRLEDARRRTEACRASLGGPAQEVAP